MCLRQCCCGAPVAHRLRVSKAACGKKRWKANRSGKRPGLTTVFLSKDTVEGVVDPGKTKAQRRRSALKRLYRARVGNTVQGYTL